MKRYIEIIPFVNEKRQKLKLESTFPAAAIFDNFRGQTTDVILSLLRSYNIIPIQLPANCTDKLQPLDISVDKPMKDHLKNKFQQWYAQEVKKTARNYSNFPSYCRWWITGYQNSKC